MNLGISKCEVASDLVNSESNGRGHNPDLKVQMPAYSHENVFIPTKEVIPGTTNIGPRNRVLEGL